jgi:hypothetical protein
MSAALEGRGVQIETQPILTFHGTDGCGKTTIATDFFAQQLLTNPDVLLLGSSDCEKWLDAAVYTRYVGSSERLERGTATNARARDLVNFYEDVAVCLYGVVRDHIASRGPVIIHSDPYLKRLTWARKYFGDDDFWEYANRFDSYMTELIGDVFSSHVAIVKVDEKTSFDRAQQRGGVKGFDPETEEDNQLMAKAVDYIETTLLGDERPYERLIGSKTCLIANPTASEEDQDELFRTIRISLNSFIR